MDAWTSRAGSDINAASYRALKWYMATNLQRKYIVLLQFFYNAVWKLPVVFGLTVATNGARNTEFCMKIDYRNSYKLYMTFTWHLYEVVYVNNYKHGNDAKLLRSYLTN